MANSIETPEKRRERNFHDMLETKWRNDQFTCVGLDIEYEKIPEHIRNQYDKENEHWKAMLHFGKSIVDATHDIASAYKPQSAHYETEGPDGEKALHELVRYIKEKDPTIPIILDAKRGDVKSTNEQYARGIFDKLGVDAVTLQPYLGSEPLEPFLKRKEKGCIILCRTSNPGAAEIQDLIVEGRPLWQKIAELVKNLWNQNNNCLLVVGATYPGEMQKVRSLVGDIPFLIPGIGAQGGDLESSVKAAMDSNKHGMIINSSRGIIYASSGEDFAERAREETIKLHTAINAARL